MVDQCEDFDPSAITGKATVTQKVIPKNWTEFVGLEFPYEHCIKDDGKTFFVQKQ